MKKSNLNFKARWLLVPLVLISLGVGQIWGTDVTLASWSFSNGTAGTNYPAINTEFAASSGTCTSGSTFNIAIASVTYNTSKNSFAFTTTNGNKTCPVITIKLKLASAIPSGTELTLTAYASYNNNTNKPCGSYNITVSTDNSTYSTTGLGTTSWTLSNGNPTEKSTVYTTQANLAANSYIYFKFTGQTRSGNGQGYFNNPIITMPAASCTDNPSVGAASLNGSFASGGVTSLSNLSEVFAAASSGAGSNCSLSENGFVWSSSASTSSTLKKGETGVTYIAGGTPDGSNDGAFTGTLSGTWTENTTYYYRSYVKNNGNNVAYNPASDVNSFTPRKITFNSNDGSTVNPIYIASGGVMTAPDAPTKANCVFAGWYSNEGLTSPVNWGAAVTASTTYYAKWYTISVNVKDEAGNTLSGSGKPTASCTGTTLSTAAGSEKYVFKEWQVSNAELGSSKETASNSLTNITGNVTVTAVYHAPITLTKGTNTGASTFNFSSNPIGYGETLTITCAADAGHKGNPAVTADGTHGTISVVSATSVTIANVQSAMTVNISYDAKETATVKLHVAGSTSTISGTRYEGDSYTLPSEAAECPDMGLYGWYTTDYEHATTAPSGANFKLPGASATLAAGDNDFYAVYATVTPDAADTYTKITTTGELVTGDYLIVGTFYSTMYAMKNAYESSESTMADESRTVTDNKITNSASDKPEFIWHFTKSNSTITIYSANSSKYFGFSSNHVALMNSSQNLTYEVSDGKWAIYSGSDCLTYSSYFQRGASKVYDVSLYKRDQSISGPYTTDPSCTTHTLTVNMDPVAPDGCSAAAVKTVLGETKTTTASATAGDHYVFSYWTISGTGSTMSNTSDGKSTDNPVTVTMGTDDATLTAHFTEKEKCTVVFKNNGTQLSSTTYWRGENPVAPTLTDGTDHDACDETSDTHYGWTQTAWQNTLEQAAIDAKTAADVKVYAKDATLPAITAGDDGTTITYHAVWAEGSGGTTTISIDGSGLQAVVSSISSGYQSKDFTVGGYTFNASAVTKCTDTGTAQYWFQLKKNNDAITIPTLPGKITNISSTAIRTATSGSVSTGVYFNSSATTSAAIASETLSGATSFSLDVTGNNTSGYLLFGAATCINQLSVTYSTASYSKYRTTCCENIVDAPTVTGTPTKNSITLSWTNVTGATGYTVTCSGGTPGEVTSSGNNRTCEITGLDPNTAYTWTVVATYTSPYCQATAANGSTTTQQVYAVSYNKNGGSSVTVSPLPASANYAAGEPVTVAAKPNTTTNAGYAFTGWNTQQDGQGSHYSATAPLGTFTMPASPVTLYAEWTARTYYYVDRMHNNGDGEHTKEIDGVTYNCYVGVAKHNTPNPADNSTGSNSCVTGHSRFVGWVISTYIGAQGQLLNGYTIIAGGKEVAAEVDGRIYYAVWAEE